jgi:hypothetical protein
MSPHRLKVALAGLAAFIGAVIAWRALFLKGLPSSVPSPVSLAPGARALLDGIVLDTIPTRDTVGSAVAAASARVRAEAVRVAGVPPASLDDLGTACTERLRALLDGDFDGHVRANRARGDTINSEQVEASRAQWSRGADLTRFAPVAPDQAEVRVIFQGGRRVAPTPAAEGFATLVTTPSPKGRFPVPADPIRERSLVVEARIPARLRTVDGPLRTVLIGYQFVWSPARSQWIPWSSVIYKDPNDAHFGLPF